MKRKYRKLTPEEKERLIHDIQRIGVVAGCRKHQLEARTYYNWLDRYEAGGLEGLKDRRGISSEASLKKRDKEIRLLKEIIAEKELTIKLQQDIIEKKYKAWKKKEI